MPVLFLGCLLKTGHNEHMDAQSSRPTISLQADFDWTLQPAYFCCKEQAATNIRHCWTSAGRKQQPQIDCQIEAQRKSYVIQCCC